MVNNNSIPEVVKTACEVLEKDPTLGRFTDSLYELHPEYAGLIDESLTKGNKRLLAWYNKEMETKTFPYLLDYTPISRARETLEKLEGDPEYGELLNNTESTIKNYHGKWVEVSINNLREYAEKDFSTADSCFEDHCDSRGRSWYKDLRELPVDLDYIKKGLEEIKDQPDYNKLKTDLRETIEDAILKRMDFIDVSMKGDKEEALRIVEELGQHSKYFQEKDKLFKKIEENDVNQLRRRIIRTGEGVHRLSTNYLESAHLKETYKLLKTLENHPEYGKLETDLSNAIKEGHGLFWEEELRQQSDPECHTVWSFDRPI